MRRLIEYLYFKYCKPDIVRATRILLHGVQPELKIEELNAAKRTAFLGDCRELLGSEVLQRVLDNLINTQIDMAINQAKDWEATLFARATINGISLVREQLQSHTATYETENKTEEVLDKFKIL